MLSFLPGTYGTCLLRNHALAGVYDSMADEGLPAEFVDGIRESIDCSLTFFGHPVSVGVMYAVLIGAILLLTGVYVLMSSARAAAVTAQIAQTALSPPTDSAGHTNRKRPQGHSTQYERK